MSRKVRGGINSLCGLPTEDLDRPISDLLAEAIADLVRKHGRAEVVYSTVAPESKKGKE